MRRRTKSVAGIFCLCFVLLLFSCCETVFGAGKTGSVSVSMKNDQEQYVGGGKLTIYHIADLTEEHGKEQWVFVEELKDCGISLDDVESESFAAAVKEYVEQEDIDGTVMEIPDTGELVIDNLPEGIYLILQNEAPDGYYPINAFAVTIPLQDASGGRSYQVDATPKMEKYTEENKKPELPPEDQTMEPELPEKEEAGKPETTSGAQPQEQPEEKLPQTGQMNWPVPVLAVCGTIVFLAGFGLVLRKRKDKNAP